MIGKNTITLGPKLQTKRFLASSVVINEDTLWVTGGLTYQGQDFKAENLKEVQTTELVTLDKSVPGPALIHMPVKGHCLISVSETKARCLKITKSLIQHCERSELRLHFEWTKVN